MVHLTGTHTEVVVIVVSVVDSRGCDGSVMFTSWVERLPEKTKKKRKSEKFKSTTNVSKVQFSQLQHF